MDKVNRILDFAGLSSFDWIIVLILISGTIFGAITLISPFIRWIKIFVLRNDKPFLVQDNEWNHIIDFEGEKVGVAMISIKNKPVRITDNSVAYNVSANISFFDRKDKPLLRIKCGYWTRTSPEHYFADAGKKKKCEKIDFYPSDTWYLPIVYKWEDEDTVYGYDPASSIKSKKLGKLPMKFTVIFEGENIKSTRPLQYLLKPQPAGLSGGFWIQKR
jgi:hypothetical protein